MKLIIAFLVAFLLGCVLAPLIIFVIKKVGARQNILHYVSMHQSKQGTPTMGGLIFLLPIVVVFLVLFKDQSHLAFVALGTMLSFGLLGFLDDFIKVHTHKNLGLRAYQKIIGQVGISIIVAIFTFYYVGGTLDFAGLEVNLSWGIIPFTILVLLAMSNAANLTDGLDGLAGWTSFVMFIGLATILGFSIQNSELSGVGLDEIAELKNLQLLSVCCAGGLLAFLCFNSYPASIFMGDTGSLALGGAIASIAIFSHKALLLPIISLVFVVSVVSVIIQVIHFKRTHKRIFLMAPIHHHFEKKGVNESKIVVIYIVVTIISCLVAILLC